MITNPFVFKSHCANKWLSYLDIPFNIWTLPDTLTDCLQHNVDADKNQSEFGHKHFPKFHITQHFNIYSVSFLSNHFFFCVILAFVMFNIQLSQVSFIFSLCYFKKWLLFTLYSTWDKISNLVPWYLVRI